MRYGIGLVLLLLILLLCICRFIPYDRPLRLPLHVFPNVQVAEIRTPAAGTMLHVGADEGERVKASDTLFVIRSGNEKIALTAPVGGRVRMVDYSLTHEPVLPRQLLAEICPQEERAARAYALLDALPEQLTEEQLDQHIILQVSGQPVRFSLLRLRRPADGHSPQALYRSDEPLDISHPIDTTWQLNVQSGNLLEQFIQIRIS